MFDVNVGLGMIGNERTRDFARSGLAGAPVRHDPPGTPRRALRRRLAMTLHRLADHLDPTPAVPRPAAPRRPRHTADRQVAMSHEAHQKAI
jgi:hypothetical protein